MIATQRMHDIIVIGSGFGGAMTAHALIEAGRDVVLVERGDWVERGPENWQPRGSLELTRYYSSESPYHIAAGGYGKTMGSCFCVGGPSVFYGCVAFRFREKDFDIDPDVKGDSGAEWPFGYGEIEPYYSRAEAILDIAGDDRADPTRPRRSAEFPQRPAPLAKISQRIADAARSLGLNPFSLPLAINHATRAGRRRCVACRTCDTFACAVKAKNDIATTVLTPLLSRGLDLRTGTVVTRLIAENGRIAAVECVDKQRGETVRLGAHTVVLSAGTLASPHILLASDLARENPGGATVGRYLMRHCNAMIFGFYPRRPDPERRFHKQLAIHDYYFGDTNNRGSSGKLGCIQQVATPPIELVRHYLPWGLRTVLAPLVEHLTGLLVIAEDQPQPDNRVVIDRSVRDSFGLPRLVVTHRYSKRDRRACRTLAGRAKKVLRRSGAWLSHTHNIKTFSHAVGTVRMGKDPETSALDEFCRFRGIDNLYVVDGSFMPSSAGLNPSLTISANALRVGEYLAQNLP
ncbi:MAG: GMC family oxidoreductase [Proteobacteria bacterium]|nr:GMC family oxidoreductase [Pseudomonadota bacterium]